MSPIINNRLYNGCIESEKLRAKIILPAIAINSKINQTINVSKPKKPVRVQ